MKLEFHVNFRQCVEEKWKIWRNLDYDEFHETRQTTVNLNLLLSYWTKTTKTLKILNFVEVYYND